MIDYYISSLEIAAVQDKFSLNYKNMIIAESPVLNYYYKLDDYMLFTQQIIVHHLEEYIWLKEGDDDLM